MEYYLDTEFHEYKKKVTNIQAGPGHSGHTDHQIDTIELISIGIVDSNGKSYYAICNEFSLNAAWENDWLRKNVLLPIHKELDEVVYLDDAYSGVYHGEDSVTGRPRLELLLRKHGKSKQQIMTEIKLFCNVATADDLEYTGIDEENHVFKFKHTEVSWLVNKNLSSDEQTARTLLHEHTANLTNETATFYAYYADYDWVVFCWLFGRMIDLPKGFPMYCVDLKQELDTIGNPNIDHLTQDNEHNALEDAKWNRELHQFILDSRAKMAKDNSKDISPEISQYKIPEHVQLLGHCEVSGKNLTLDFNNEVIALEDLDAAQEGKLPEGEKVEFSDKVVSKSDLEDKLLEEFNEAAAELATIPPETDLNMDELFTTDELVNIGRPEPISVDFDGTCVMHEFPNVGEDVPGAVDVLQRLSKRHKILLSTMRSGKTLIDAVNWFAKNNIPLSGINENPEQPKIYSVVHIDDTSLGCPLVHTEDNSRNYVDWVKVEELLIQDGWLTPKKLFWWGTRNDV